MPESIPQVPPTDPIDEYLSDSDIYSFFAMQSTEVVPLDRNDFSAYSAVESSSVSYIDDIRPESAFFAVRCSSVLNYIDDHRSIDSGVSIHEEHPRPYPDLTDEEVERYEEEYPEEPDPPSPLAYFVDSDAENPSDNIPSYSELTSIADRFEMLSPTVNSPIYPVDEVPTDDSVFYSLMAKEKFLNRDYKVPEPTPVQITEVEVFERYYKRNNPPRELDCDPELIRLDLMDSNQYRLSMKGDTWKEFESMKWIDVYTVPIACLLRAQHENLCPGYYPDKGRNYWDTVNNLYILR